MNELISVKEKLPAINKDVLIRNEHFVYAVCFRIGRSTWVESTSPRDEIVKYCVTHWHDGEMPLSKPSEEKP